jgi:hypothetical protein
VQSFFAVDHTSGEVTVMRELDRDIAAVVRITVLVIDTTAPTTQQGKGILYFHLPFSLFLSYVLTNFNKENILLHIIG